MKVLIYSGSVMRADAIGEIVLARMDALQRAGHNVTCFTASTDIVGRGLELAASVDAVRVTRQFREADIHHFEYGWHYPLFDAFRHVPRGSRRTIGFHGVVPKPFLAMDAHQGHDLAIRQLRMASRADAVVVSSPFAADEIARLGVPRRKIRVVALPARLPEFPRPARPDGPVRLLFVGRMVAVKGFREFLEALIRLRDAGETDWTLEVVTNPLNADPAYLRQMRQLLSPFASQLAFFGRIDDRSDLAQRYARADLVVVPSQYETYGLAVAEALSAGAAIIANDVGGIAFAGQGLARLVAAGDGAALGDALLEGFHAVRHGEVLVGSGERIGRAEFEARRAERAAQWSPLRHDDAFVDLVRTTALEMSRTRQSGRRPSLFRFLSSDKS